MSGLPELQSKVEAAQQRYGALGERQREVGVRLRNLNEMVEDGLRHKQLNADLSAEIAELKAENEALKRLVESLVEAADAEEPDYMSSALEALEQNTAHLVEGPADAQAETGGARQEDGSVPAAPSTVPPSTSQIGGESPDTSAAATASALSDDDPTNAFSKIRKHIGRGR